MQLQPHRDRPQPRYPRAGRLLRSLGLAALGAAAVGRTAVAGNKPADTTAPAAENENDNEAAAKARLTELIARLSKKLGDDAFKVRQQATLSLIKLGQGEGQKQTAKALARELVLARMQDLETAKDPEVTQRARRVIKALQPPKEEPPDDGWGGGDNWGRTAGVIVE